MPEFSEWRRRPFGLDGEGQILWIHGSLGIDKSIMAAYFVDLIKCLHPIARVAYFFCHSEEEGLRTASDILRMLAYQCAQNNRYAVSQFSSLRARGFRIENDIGVNFLFEELLQKMMCETKEETYMILDGLDEADITTHDERGPQMNVLVKRLCSLLYMRLLFISRPNFHVSSIVPNLIVKSLSRDDNLHDIRTYISTTVFASRRLQINFETEQVDPLEYFHKYANGVFLWVVLVLRQLATIKSLSNFRECLHSFARAPGDME